MDNPQAFPSEAVTVIYPKEMVNNPLFIGKFREIKTRGEGMTLRDYFAGQALVGCLSATTKTEITDKTVITCYKIADAMLEERSKHG